MRQVSIIMHFFIFIGSEFNPQTHITSVRPTQHYLDLSFDKKTKNVICAVSMNFSLLLVFVSCMSMMVYLTRLEGRLENLLNTHTFLFYIVNQAQSIIAHLIREPVA